MFDPRRIGTLFHDAIETTPEQAAAKWQNELCITSTRAEDELLKLYTLAPKAKEFIPEGSRFEVELEDDKFHGFIDVLSDDTIIDIKRSNRIDYYLNSGQVGVYAREIKRLMGIDVKHLYYLFVPNVSPRRYRKCKSRPRDEEEWEFRNRLRSLLENSEVKLVEASADCGDYYEVCSLIDRMIKNNEPFEPNLKSCSKCDYKGECENASEKRMGEAKSERDEA